MTAKLTSRTKLLLCTTLVSVGFMPMQALAQAAGGSQLADIVVTAQKREQNVQDVPIAVTALGAAALAANRVVSVTDLSGLAPGVQVVTSAGGSQLPAFSVRGVTSYGVVPGSDKEVSIYLDGVYISSPRGSIFNLPDMNGIEVLRGPQGTLFGRNATAGAVSLTTRDPNGKVGATAVFTAGNYDQFGAKMTVSTPQIGPFSAYVTYAHQYKRGDVKNLGAGTTWDRSASPSPQGIVAASPAYLGTKRADSYFIAVKFQPTDNFKMVYKHDHDAEMNSPEATGNPAYNPLIPKLSTVFANHPELFFANGLRPDAVNNGFSLTSPERVFGHSVTATWDAADNLTFKNITAWRNTFISVATSYDGLAGFKLTAADSAALGAGGALTGAIYGIAGIAPESKSIQFSNELQMNYRSKLVTLTSGLMWFHGTDFNGAPYGYVTSTTFPQFPNPVTGAVVLPIGKVGNSYNDAKSAAFYSQAEIHVTPKLDLVLGGRITKDNKSGTFVGGPIATAITVPFTFVKTKPTWLVGVNYKPTDDVMLYAKASTAYVSGGSASGVPFQPETALSFEGGIKAEWLDRRLRTNLSVYTVTYKYLQTAQGSKCCAPVIDAAGAALTPPIANLSSLISTFVASLGGQNNPGPVTATGFEFEGVASLGHGLTTGGSLSYHHTKYSYVDPNLVLANNGEYLPTLQPDWTGSVWAQYESKPFANGSHISARIDGNWHGNILMVAYPDKVATNPLLAFMAPYVNQPASWIVNGRVALSDINIGGVDAEVALWGKNLFQNRNMTFGGNLSNIVAQANWTAARTLGVDVKIHY